MKTETTPHESPRSGNGNGHSPETLPANRHRGPTVTRPLKLKSTQEILQSVARPRIHADGPLQFATSPEGDALVMLESEKSTPGDLQVSSIERHLIPPPGVTATLPTARLAEYVHKLRLLGVETVSVDVSQFPDNTRVVRLLGRRPAGRLATILLQGDPGDESEGQRPPREGDISQSPSRTSSPSK